jgi:serine/threonine-protein kinase
MARGTYDYVFYKDFESAESYFQAAYDRNPSSLEVVNTLGWVQRRLGQWEEALATFLKAKELDPGDVSQNLVIAEHLMYMRRYNEAERYYELMRELEPDDDETAYLLTEFYLKKDGNTDRAEKLLKETISSKGSIEMLYIKISDVTVQRVLVFGDSLLVAKMKASYRPGSYYLYGEMYNQIGETGLAMEQYDSLRAADETLLNSGCRGCALFYTLYPELGFLYARLGMKEKALRYAELGVEKLPVSRDALQGMVHLEYFAKVCAITGEKDRALDMLDRILAMPISVHITPGTLRLDPLWDPIRDDPRFDELIGKYSKGAI